MGGHQFTVIQRAGFDSKVKIYILFSCLIGTSSTHNCLCSAVAQYTHAFVLSIKLNSD